MAFFSVLFSEQSLLGFTCILIVSLLLSSLRGLHVFTRLSAVSDMEDASCGFLTALFCSASLLKTGVFLKKSICFRGVSVI